MKKHFILSLVFVFSFACSITRAETQQYEILHTPEQEEARQRELEEKRLRVERGPFSLYPFGDFDKENQNFYGIAPLWTYSPRDFYGLGVGILSEVERDVVGVSLSVIGDRIHGDFTGIQMVGWSSETRGDFTGIQAGFVSVTRGDFTGIQIGLLASGSGRSHDEFFGIQLGGMINDVYGDFTGLQVGLFNFVEGNLHGIQIGLWNECKQGNMPLINIRF